MVSDTKNQWFEGIDTVVAEPLKFKAKLAIGEDAYTSVRLKNATLELWDAVGVAKTAASIASSSVVASKFFATAGIQAVFGFGASATPVGWVVAAALVAGGGWIGITRYLKQNAGSKVTVIPQFINTPIDVLALGLFDLMAPLALKVAEIDGEVDASERALINSYFVKHWGYGADFVREGMAFVEEKIKDFSIKGLAQSLGEFKKHNKDCNYKAMSQEIVSFLNEIMTADGKIDEREEMAIEKVRSVFNEIDAFQLKTAMKSTVSTLTSAVGKVSTQVFKAKKGGKV
jgi:tellurite resistance protein